jgi:hypothetical protein
LVVIAQVGDYCTALVVALIAQTLAGVAHGLALSQPAENPAAAADEI